MGERRKRNKVDSQLKRYALSYLKTGSINDSQINSEAVLLIHTLPHVPNIRSPIYSSRSFTNTAHF